MTNGIQFRMVVTCTCFSQTCIITAIRREPLTASANYSMTRKLQSTLEASAIQWPALRNDIPCMAHVIELALDAFMSSLGVKHRTKSWEAHESDQHFGENESRDIRKSQKLRKEGNTRIKMVSAMKPGLAMIIEKVHIS